MSALMSPAAFDSTVSHDEPRSIDDLDRDICRLVRQMNAESYRLLVLVREFDDRFGFAKWSFKCCAEWLAWRCSISPSAAREKVRTAQALRHLPAISAAFADGRLSYSKVRALTRVAQVRDEDLLLAYALETTAAQVEERCRQIRNVTPNARGDAERAWGRRSLSLWRHDASNTLRITVELPIEEGELIARAIDCAVAAGEVSTGLEPDAVEPPKSTAWRAQQADALVAIARAYLEGGGAAAERRSTADHYQVVVHVDEQALREGVGRADLPLPTVERLACDGSLVTAVDDERGEPLDVGRKRRTVSASLKRALYSRDRGCTFPGCQRHRYLDAHHLVHWAHGGETSRDNLTLLCTHHHRLLHEGGFRALREVDGRLRFERPDGRTIPRCGYRIEDFVDDDIDGVDDEIDRGNHRYADGATAANASREPSREGLRTATVQKPSAEVREPRAIYRIVRPRLVSARTP